MGVSAPTPGCGKKCRCPNGPNRDDLFDCSDPCRDKEYVIWDKSICDCVSDGTQGYIRYDQPATTWDLTVVSCFCDGNNQPSCPNPQGCCYPDPENPYTFSGVSNLRVPFSGTAPFPITQSFYCTRTQEPGAANDQCGCPTSVFSGIARVYFYDADGVELGYASVRNQGFGGTLCSSGNPAPCEGTYPVTNVREFVV